MLIQEKSRNSESKPFLSLGKKAFFFWCCFIMGLFALFFFAGTLVGRGQIQVDLGQNALFQEITGLNESTPANTETVESKEEVPDDGSNFEFYNNLSSKGPDKEIEVTATPSDKKKTKQVVKKKLDIVKPDHLDDINDVASEQPSESAVTEKKPREPKEKPKAETVVPLTMTTAVEKPKTDTSQKTKVNSEDKTKKAMADKAKTDAQTKTKTESSSKTKSETADKSKSDSTQKTKTETADKSKSDSTQKAKTETANKSKSDSTLKTKTETADKAKSDSTPKTKTETADKSKSDSTPKAKTATADNAKKTEKPKAPEKDDKGGKKFSLQVAALKNADDADTMVKKLSGLGFAAYSIKSGDNESWYKVRVGSFKDRAEAEKTITKLKSKNYDAFVVSR